jgi:hypothetical protein
MPTYLVIRTFNGEETSNRAYEAADDAEAAAKLRQYLAAGYTPRGFTGAQPTFRCEKAELGALQYYRRMARPQIGFDTYIGIPGAGRCIV